MNLRRNIKHKVVDRAHEVSDRVSDRTQQEKQAALDALHRRPEKGGEWDTVAPEDRNIHQRIAAKTLGIVTLANTATLLGAGLSASAIVDYKHGNYKKAAGKMFVGRMLDLADGYIATKTGTRSEIGAALDAGCDKGLSVAFVTVSTLKRDMRLVESSTHLMQQGRIFYENVHIKNAGGEPNPTREGKYGMAALSLRAGGILVHKTFRSAAETAQSPQRIRQLTLAADIIETASEFASGAAVYFNNEAGDTYREERVSYESQLQAA